MRVPDAHINAGRGPSPSGWVWRVHCRCVCILPGCAAGDGEESSVICSTKSLSFSSVYWYMRFTGTQQRTERKPIRREGAGWQRTRPACGGATRHHGSASPRPPGSSPSFRHRLLPSESVQHPPEGERRSSGWGGRSAVGKAIGDQTLPFWSSAAGAGAHRGRSLRTDLCAHISSPA